MSDLWKPDLQTQAFEADGAYDTRALHHADDRANWLLRRAGNSITFHQSGPYGENNWLFERPFASSRPVSIVHFPYFVNEGLHALELGIYCRVSDHWYDAGQELHHVPDWVILRPRLLGINAGAAIEISPRWVSGSPNEDPPDWQYRVVTLQLPSSPPVGWTWFSLQIECPVLYQGGSPDDGLVVQAVIASNVPGRLGAASDIYNAAALAPYNETHGANEVTVSTLREIDGTPHGTWDHVRQLGDNDMWVWPVGPMPTHNSTWRLWKGSMPYLQWRSMSLTEIYDRQTGIPSARKLPAAKTIAGVPATIGRAANAVNTRRRLLCAGNEGVPNDEWPSFNTPGYRMRSRVLTGTDGLQLLQGNSAVPGVLLEHVEVRVVVSGFYMHWSITDDLRDLGKTYAEMQDCSVEGVLRLSCLVAQVALGGGFVLLGTASKYHRMPFVFGERNTHHLVTLARQSNAFDIDGDGYVYREGYLDVGTDLPVLFSPANNASLFVQLAPHDPTLPLRVELRAEIMPADDPDHGARFLDADTAATAFKVEGKPFTPWMRATLIGMSVWGDA